MNKNKFLLLKPLSLGSIVMATVATYGQDGAVETTVPAMYRIVPAPFFLFWSISTELSWLFLKHCLIEHLKKQRWLRKP